MTIYYVPDDFGDIATALAGISSSDELIVRDGTYTGVNNNNLDPVGLDPITIRSENGEEFCTIDGENSGRRGFVLDNGESNSVLIKGFTITRCGAKSGSDYGGGMLIYNSSPTIENIKLVSNKASYGGGIAVEQSSAAPIIQNVLFLSNDASDGGGLHIRIFNTATLRNCTFHSNTASRGGGLGQNTFAAPNLYNSIFWGNTASSIGNEIWMGYSGYVNISYCCYNNDPGDISGTFASESNTTTSDPVYTTSVYGNEYLGTGSSAIDSGTNAQATPDWSIRTTVPSQALDSGTVDMGYHWIPAATGPTAVGCPFGNVNSLRGGIA